MNYDDCTSVTCFILMLFIPVVLPTAPVSNTSLGHVGGEWRHAAQMGGEYLPGLCSVRWRPTNGRIDVGNGSPLAFPLEIHSTLLYAVGESNTSCSGKTIR